MLPYIIQRLFQWKIVLINTCGHRKTYGESPAWLSTAETSFCIPFIPLYSFTLPSLPLPSSSSLSFLSFCFYSFSRLLYKGNALFLNSYYLVFLQPISLFIGLCQVLDAACGLFILSGRIFCRGACPVAHSYPILQQWTVGPPGFSAQGVTLAWMRTLGGSWAPECVGCRSCSWDSLVVALGMGSPWKFPL